MLKTSIAVGIGLALAMAAVDGKEGFKTCSKLSRPAGNVDAGVGSIALGIYANIPALFSELI
ncbi:hypothetical protein ASZ90_017423 [hydrocarbon metagenome]|uniref:Uncharacterized protein n=1 Tax=hydrocarbon metagenome TaxID=938273 RepID=A0A0W8E951_9ZZZZ